MRPLLALGLVSLFVSSSGLAAVRPLQAGAYTLDSALEDIAANPAAAEVIHKDIPGLLENRSYPMFKSLSLRLLGSLSGGRLTASMLAQTEADLSAVPAPLHARLRTVARQAADPDFN
jgi:hypothetical protein